MKLTPPYKSIVCLLVPACLVLISGCAGNSSPAPKTWTVMLYLDGDDVNMQHDFLDNLEEIVAANVGSTADVNIVLQFDRYPLHRDWSDADPRFGGWVITHRFYLTPGLPPTEANAIADWGDGQGGREIDMSNPDNLRDFISWARQRFPAEHYMLVLADHGFGWKGLNADESSFGSHMTIQGLKQALSRASTHIDILAFNACLMQMIEVAYELSGLPVDTMVGSEMPGMKWPVAAILKTITDNPAVGARQIGKAACDLYVDRQSPYGTVTLSMLDLSRIATLTTAFKDLAQAMLTADNFSTVQQRASVVLTALDAVVLYNRANRFDAHGLAIYFQAPESLRPPADFSYFYQHQIISFSTDSTWRDFLTVFYDLMGHQEYPIDNRIFAIRAAMTDFGDPNVDIYDFCQRIVNYVDN